jgi:uncharacterized protein (TIGR04551 family)
MSRTRLLAASAALLLAAGARAEDAKKDAAPVDPKVEALIKEAVEKAKQDLRDELKVELQGAQSAAEFLGTAAEGPKLEFFEVDGYLRTRADLFDDFGLKRGLDANGVYLFPAPIDRPDARSTLASANMRLRLEPTLNVSEHVRVRIQADLLDNYVLGATLPAQSQYLNTPATGQSSGASGTDRAVFNLKRAWGEVETPLGLLSFGRMPTAWGLGIRLPVNDGLDDDWGHTVDRMQFATLPLTTPVGQLTFVPYLDFRSEGTLSADVRYGAGAGQPFDRDSGDDARTFGLRAVRLDTDAELRRKLDRGEASVNYGAFYEYQTWASLYPTWLQSGFGDTTGNSTDPTKLVQRKEYEHVFDLWYRYRTARFHLEAEVSGQIGQIGNPTLDPAYTGPQILVRQFGGAARASYQVSPNKFSMGMEIGVASGDSAPGFGNRPNQLDVTDPTNPKQPSYGAAEGPQFGTYTHKGKTIVDRDIRNFRFDPGYRVDLILWREILGQVTDAVYFRPSIRWDIVSGLAFDAAIIYSQAIYSTSTPSATENGDGNSPLGLELDTKLSYTGDDGFSGWLQYGLLQPLDGFSGAGVGLGRAHAVRAGLALRC